MLLQGRATRSGVGTPVESTGLQKPENLLLPGDQISLWFGLPERFFGRRGDLRMTCFSRA